MKIFTGFNSYKMSQLKRNIFSGSVVHGVNILFAFISYPLYIHFLGMKLFSVWVLLSVIIAVAQFGDFGIGKAVINFVASAKEEGRQYDITNIIFNALLIVTSVSVFIQMGLWIFNPGIIRLLNIPSEYISQATKVIPLIGISIFTYLIFDNLNSTITGLGRIDISNLLLLSMNFLKILLTIILLYYSPSLESMVYGVLISNLFFLLIPLIILSKLKLALYHKKIAFSKPLLKKLVAYGTPVMGIQVVNIFMFPFIKIVIARFFSIEYVGFMELATKAAYSFRTLFEKGLVALLPEYSKYAGSYKNDVSVKEILRVRVLKITKMNIYAGLPFFILLAVFSQFLLKFWLGKEYNINVFYGYLLLQPGILFGLFALPSYYALLAIQKQHLCFFEAIIRLGITLLLFLGFVFFKLSYLYVFVFISIAVIISNAFIIQSFFKRT